MCFTIVNSRTNLRKKLPTFHYLSPFEVSCATLWSIIYYILPNIFTLYIIYIINDVSHHINSLYENCTRNLFIRWILFTSQIIFCITLNYHMWIWFPLMLLCCVTFTLFNYRTAHSSTLTSASLTHFAHTHTHIYTRTYTYTYTPTHLHTYTVVHTRRLV